MQAYVGAIVRIGGLAKHRRAWVVWDKRGSTCWLVENLDVPGPRMGWPVYVGDAHVDFAVKQSLTHKRWPDVPTRG